MKILLTASILLAIAGCTSHAYVSLTPSETLRDVNLRSGTVTAMWPSGGRTIVGLAADGTRRAIYARVDPGNRLAEYDRETGALRRLFNAERVPPGCGTSVPVEILVCGLAIRLFDKHLFLDHPQGNPIYELDNDGKWIRDIRLQSPGGVIGGIAYDQRNRVLYVIFVTTSTVAEIDLNGVEQRRFSLSRPVQPEGLSIGVNSDRLYVPLVSGSALGEFDMNGQFVRQFPLNRAGFAGGVGVDSQRTNRVGP